MARSSESDFSGAIMRTAVAQICQSVGYGAAQTSALDTLSDIAARYLKAIAKFATASANSCGRTQANLFDIIIALEDLGSVQGFPGASSSTTPNSLISSSLLKEIKRFVLYSDEIPFAQPLPPRNLPTLRRCCGHSNEKGSYGYGVNLGHVPRWLPDMPVIGGKEVEGGKGEDNLRWDFAGEEQMAEVKGKGKEEGKGNGAGFELPEKRGKVRFEMRVKGGSGAEGNRGMGRGVLSRGGIGKRVLCHNLGSVGCEVERDGKEEKVAMRPR